MSWYGSAKLEPDRPGSEAAVQALCGLMGVNGRDRGRPRPIGIEITSAPGRHRSGTRSSAETEFPAPVCADEELASLPADPRFSELFDTLADTRRAPGSPWRLHLKALCVPSTYRNAQPCPVGFPLMSALRPALGDLSLSLLQRLLPVAGARRRSRRRPEIPEGTTVMRRNVVLEKLRAGSFVIA